MQLTRLIVYVLLAIVANAGCSNFEHPLPWERSSIHAELPGVWRTGKDSTTPMEMNVSTDESGHLKVEINIDNSEDTSTIDPSLPFLDESRHVTFGGDVLASNDVHVLQIDMESYEERVREDDEPKRDDGEGYRFVRVVLEGNTVSFQLIDMEQFARFAETQLGARKVTVSAQAFSKCLNDKVKSEIDTKLLNGLLEQDRSAGLLTDAGRAEIESVVQSHRLGEVEPYEELQGMRVCIAFLLPGEVLARLFSSEPTESFGGVTIRMAKAI